ncbi:LytR C-terminal domain-containing protein [Streptomyces sp. M10(2022)]
MVALIVVVALVVVGGAGYLWFTDKIPGLSGSDEKSATATGPQKRDVIVVHLHNTRKGGTSTALLVDNVTTGKGTTVLLPNSSAWPMTTVPPPPSASPSTTTARPGRESRSTLCSAPISAAHGGSTPRIWRPSSSWSAISKSIRTPRCPTPRRVRHPGQQGRGADAERSDGRRLRHLPGAGRARGEAAAAVRAGDAQCAAQDVGGAQGRHGHGPDARTDPRPSLPEQDLGASLAKLAGHAKVGDYKTELLPVQEDGTLTEAATESVVKDVLGGAVKAPDEGAAVRVGIKNATGNTNAPQAARVQLVNGGYAFVDGGKSEAEASSEVIHRTAEDKAKAVEVAKTLGLPGSAVQQGKPAANADVSVVLGQDYKIKQQAAQ